MERITESSSLYERLDQMSTLELLHGINEQDHEVPRAVEKIIDQIHLFVEACFERMQQGGRTAY